MSAQATRRTGKSQRRDDIVTAARALMRKGGDTGFSMRALAEEAGVSIATPYNVFGSKQNVLLAVLDDDLAAYEATLAALTGDPISILFDSIDVLHTMLDSEPDFYRGMLAAVSRDGGEARNLARGARYMVWKRLLAQATEAGLLDADADPDAFAIATSQNNLSNLVNWAAGGLSLAEMAARNHYGLALMLLALATDASRADVRARMRAAERDLQRLWRKGLAEALDKGHLDDETRARLAAQLQKLSAMEHLEDPT